MGFKFCMAEHVLFCIYGVLIGLVCEKQAIYNAGPLLSNIGCTIFGVNQYFSFILHTNYSFPSCSLLLSPTCHFHIIPSSVSIHKWADLPWACTEHGTSS